MKLIAFNLNDYVRVRLNAHGTKCLRENFDRLNEAYGGKLPFGPIQPKQDAQGWSRWQLWDLMNQFGPHITFGMNPPFATEIKLEIEEGK